MVKLPKDQNHTLSYSLTERNTLENFMQQTQMHEMTIYMVKNTQSLQVSLFYSNQAIKHVEILTTGFF
jgi:hypothetical protein